LCCAAPRDAHAYVDPGSGLVLLQGELALIGGAIVFIRHPIDSMRRLWRRICSRDSHPDA
jgi:hypothetical protein